MSYVVASDWATLEYDLSLTKGVNYTAEVEADGGTGLVGHWEIKLKALVRSS